MIFEQFAPAIRFAMSSGVCEGQICQSGADWINDIGKVSAYTWLFLL